MTIEERYKQFNPYTLGHFFIAAHKGKLGVFHSYVDTGMCYGYGSNLAETEQLMKDLRVKYQCK